MRNIEITNMLIDFLTLLLKIELKDWAKINIISSVMLG